MLKAVKKFLKVTAAMVFAAGMLTGCADNLNSADFEGTAARAGSDTATRIYAAAVTKPSESMASDSAGRKRSCCS